MVVCAIVNVHRTKSDDPVVKPVDVMPWLAEREENRRQTPEQMRALLEEITLAMGGIVHRRNVPLA